MTMKLTDISIRTLMLFLILLLEAPTLAQTSPPAHPHMTAFVHVNVVPMDGDRIVPNQTVLVEDGKIRSVGTTLPPPADALVIDGHGRAFLSPGLADMHSHSDTPEDLVVYLANGVTTILNMGDARSGFVAQDRPRVDRKSVV